MRNTARFWRIGSRILGRLQIWTSSGIRSSRRERGTCDAPFQCSPDRFHFTLKTAILYNGGVINEAEKAVLLLPLRLIFHETPRALFHYPAPIINGLTLAARSVKGGLCRRSKAIAVLGQLDKLLYIEELDGVRGSVSRRRKPQSACILISRDSTCREGRADQGGRCSEGKASGR